MVVVSFEMFRVIFASVFIACMQLSLQNSLPSDPYYVAGVVEFRPTTLVENLKSYVEFIASAEAKDVDIIVFPEMTLNNNSATTLVPDPSAGIVPCASPEVFGDNSLLVKLSCQANKSDKYVVVNVAEQEPCPASVEDTRPCAPSGLNIFNTNVVFDRNGSVISRYRKWNLFGENRNTTFQAEMATFDTDFGVRFGHFICFDIMFYTPAKAMADSLDIHDFIFPTMWFGQLPFLTGVQIQHAWAFGNDVNLLAAGASNPLVGSTGSGIYNGRRGTLVSVMKQDAGERKLYVAKVPKYPETKRRERRHAVGENNIVTRLSSELYLKRDYLENYRTVLLNLTNDNEHRSQVCYDDDWCCDFELEWTKITPSESADKQFYSYRLAAYDGPRKDVNVEVNYIRNCGIFTCTGPKIDDCGLKYSTPTTLNVSFTRISIKAKYPNSREYLIMPNSIKDDLLPIEPNQFVWQVERIGNYSHVTYATNVTISNLLTFATYGNYYDDIGTYKDGATIYTLSNILILIVLLSSFVKIY